MKVALLALARRVPLSKLAWLCTGTAPQGLGLQRAATTDVERAGRRGKLPAKPWPES